MTIEKQRLSEEEIQKYKVQNNAFNFKIMKVASRQIEKSEICIFENYKAVLGGNVTGTFRKLDEGQVAVGQFM